MQSGKQKRARIMARRKEKKQQADWQTQLPEGSKIAPAGSIRVNRSALAPYTSYGEPDFVRRGYYETVEFRCRDCGARQIWLAEQQQWWYETARGYVYSTAVRCLACRRERRLAPHRSKNMGNTA